jgi:hypothetical protein
MYTNCKIVVDWMMYLPYLQCKCQLLLICNLRTKTNMVDYICIYIVYILIYKYPTCN